ncbi:MAG: hypothetical protein GY739_12515 [Mesoflavibacter sp.]|nr:hypothetical protein [Mesoflavibacter sp.]
MKKQDRTEDENEKSIIQNNINEITEYKKEVYEHRGNCIISAKYKLRRKSKTLDKIGQQVDDLMKECGKNYDIDISFYTHYHCNVVYERYLTFTRTVNGWKKVEKKIEK